MFRILLVVCTLFGTLAFGQENKVFVFLNSKPDKEKIPEEETAELMKLHLANIEKMAIEGKLLVAGPFEGGGGIFIFNTDRVEQTKEWLMSDPAVKANRWDIEMFPIEFQTGGACLAQEPYEMVTYNFLRVNLINDIANYKMNNTILQGWQTAATADSVIMVGRFPQYDGGIIVYTGEPQSPWLQEFSNDQVSVDLKEVWVAKGSFCEH